ncbi:sensor histidine kinase [Mucilaginibacter sp. Mucisp86]|uniref:sensor histidine kinase n=1 Tax=Mucilaginibacter sp. Mucisp86 TaxID=3243060 RepID=UPI0039B3B71F
MTLKKKLLVHVLIWLIYISYELGFVVITSRIHITPAPLLIYYGLNISLFYFNAHVLLNFAFLKTRRRYLNAACLIILELAVYLAIKYVLDNLLTGHFTLRSGHLPVSHLYIYENLYRGASFTGLSIAYFSTRYMSRFREKAYEEETGRLRAITRNLELENQIFSVENAYLQNQISPHLLFNSLSFIHSAVYKLSDAAGKGIMRLAELMRYSLVSANGTGTIPLPKEIEQMENLIALCAMRFPGEFFVRVHKKGRLKGREIIPLALITLVENMLKHGDLGDKKHPARISLELAENRLIFEATNKKRHVSLYPSGGLGLKNIEKRLQNHYRDRYSMLIRNENEHFTITLTISL